MTKLKKTGLTVVGWVIFALNTLLVAGPAIVIGWISVLATIVSAATAMVTNGLIDLHKQIDKARKRITTIDI